MPKGIPYKTEEERREGKRKSWNAYYLNNKDKYKDQSKKHYQKNKESRLLQTRNWEIRNPAKRLLINARSNARTAGRDFSIEENDVIIPNTCPYLGCELTYSFSRLWTDISIDRINNSLGYIKGNIQVTSRLANFMKRDATEEQLIAFAKGVLRIHAGIDVDQISSECRELQ